MGEVESKDWGVRNPSGPGHSHIGIWTFKKTGRTERGPEVECGYTVGFQGKNEILRLLDTLKPFQSRQETWNQRNGYRTPWTDDIDILGAHSHQLEHIRVGRIKYTYHVGIQFDGDRSSTLGPSEVKMCRTEPRITRRWTPNPHSFSLYFTSLFPKVPFDYWKGLASTAL